MLIKASLLLFAAVADAYAVPSSSSDRELVLPSSNTSNYLNGGSIPTEMVRGEIHSYLPVSDIANFASTSRLAYADTELNFTQADSLSYVIDLFAHSDLGPATDVKLINSLTKPPFNQLCLREAKQLVLALHQRGMFSEMISWIQGLGNVTPGGLAHVFSTALFSDFIKLGNEQVLTLFYNTSGRNGTRTVSLLFESALMQGFDNLTQTIIDDGVLPTSPISISFAVIDIHIIAQLHTFPNRSRIEYFLNQRIYNLQPQLSRDMLMKMIASCQDVGCFSSEFSLLAYSAGLDLQKQTFAQRVARIGNLPMLRVIKKRYPQDLQHSWVTMDLFKSAIASKDFATVKFILDLMVEQTIGVAIEYAAISGTVPILKTLILKRPAVWAGLSPNTITDISHNFVKNACSMGEVMDETLDMIGFLFQAAYGINSTSEFVTSLFQMSLQGAKKCTRQSDQTVIPAYLLKKFREMNVILVQETAIVQAAISTGSRRVLHLFLKAGWRLPGTKHEYDGLFSLVLENGDGRMLRFLMEHYSPFGDAGEALKRMVTARATSRLPILDSCAAKFLLKENIIEFSKEVTSARFKQDPMFL